MKDSLTIDTEISDKLSGPSITIEEIRKAIHSSKNKHLAQTEYLDESGITVIH